jgi:uncharacterized membrane protein YGL010W
VNETVDWIELYAADHCHPANKILHGICVPLVVVSFLGLLWSIPVPAAWAHSADVLNWGTLFLMATIVYYFIMSFSLAIGILPFVAFAVAAVVWMDSLQTPLWLISSAIISIAWLGQLIGHLIEAGRGRFFRDLQYLMIGPLWMLAAVYRRLRIPY